MRVQPNAGISKLGHVGATQEHKARRPQARHTRRIASRRLRIAQDGRARRRHLPRHIEQVLDGNRNTGITRRCPALAAKRIDMVRLLQRAFRIGHQKHARAFTVLIFNAGKASLGQITRGGGARLQLVCKLIQRFDDHLGYAPVECALRKITNIGMMNATRAIRPTMQTSLYFAYGSNLLSHRLLARCPSARVLSLASTRQWTVSFTKPGGDGSGKAGLVERADATHPGVVYEIAPAKCRILDRHEGVGHGYARTDAFSVTLSQRRNNARQHLSANPP
jgi:hypothetical protein